MWTLTKGPLIMWLTTRELITFVLVTSLLLDGSFILSATHGWWAASIFSAASNLWFLITMIKVRKVYEVSS